MCAKKKMQRDWLVIILNGLVFPFLIALLIQIVQLKKHIQNIEYNGITVTTADGDNMNNATIQGGNGNIQELYNCK